MDDDADAYLAKAEESLAGALSELANGRYNNCANRCYYACFQAAVFALLREGVDRPGAASQWAHDFVQSAFVGQLINRRKIYPASIRDTLSRTIALRIDADYGHSGVTETEAQRATRRAREFVEAVRTGKREGTR